MKKTIIYLNFILTIIAVALTTIILQNADLIPKARAASSFYGLPLNEKGELPVKVMNSTMDVNIESCDSYALTYAGPITVKIKD